MSSVTMPDWVKAGFEREQDERDRCLPLLAKVFRQFERGICTVEEFRSQVNRIVG